MFEYTIRVLKTQHYFNSGMVDVIYNPNQNELEQAIEVLQKSGEK